MAIGVMRYQELHMTRHSRPDERNSSSSNTDKTRDRHSWDNAITAGNK